MPRRRLAALNNADISIRGDELEHNRILLEHNLQNTDLSLHLTDSPDIDDIEFPRHNSVPDKFSAMPSFDNRPDDHFDPDENSQYHAWSYRTVDDEEGINTYAGETVSTAAHHASALTLSAGLGGRGARRDVSVSGAEYDPDRPLHGIMAGITSRINTFNVDDANPRHAATVDFGPLVADDSADLIDAAAKNARKRLPATGLRSSSTSSSSSRPGTPLSPRPTLSDALQSVAFSPKRPRGAQSHTQTHSSERRTSRFKPTVTEADESASSPAPISKSRSRNRPLYGVFPQQSLSYATAPEPEVNVQPPTPTVETRPSATEASQPTKVARYARKEIAFDMEQQKASRRRPSSKAMTAGEKEGKTASVAIHPRVAGLRTPFRDKDKVHLPDVTGLTSAIASPARLGFEYLRYDAQDDAEIGARLVTTLGVIQAKLSHLEAENSVSRRRVRELEIELEDCKREVAKERTRIHEREHVKERQKRRAEDARAEKEQQDRDRFEADQSRYKEVVEEQKALQALVITLKGHLTRLTTELSEHHRLLEELRGLRDTDVRSLREKSREVTALRQEVERLGGEVEVLRGVVEEGLKERREVRERSTMFASPPSLPAGLQPAEDSLMIESQKRNQERLEVNKVQPHEVRLPNDESDLEEDSDKEGTSSSEHAASPTPSPRHRDRTIRTDRATVGGSPPSQGQVGTAHDGGERPFIDYQEIERISEEVSERRTERSQSLSQISVSGPREDNQNDHVVEQRHRPLSPAPPTQRVPLKARPSSPAPSSRPKTSTHMHQTQPQIRTSRKSYAAEADTEIPFPQIHGAYLERLFFSAPQHHAKTCTVCHRRQKCKGAQQDVYDRRDLKQRLRDAEAEARGHSLNVKGKERESTPDSDRVPPQTVLARVLRELEDDFTHYKEIYIELADQYKVIDPVVNVAKRNVLAEHLREVIDLLEQKGDQIASLYDLLTYNDKRRNDAEAVPSYKTDKQR